MVVNQENLSLIFINLKAIFNKAFDAAPSQFEKSSMVVPSTGVQNTYDWLNRFPKMTQWVGEKKIRNLVGHSYTIVNNDWEATVAVDRNSIEDDNLGIYSPQVTDAGFSAKQLPDQIMASLRAQSFTALCYDGQPFYNADHPVGNGNGGVTSVSNYGTQHLGADTLANAQASYGAARIAIMSVTDDDGRPLGLIPDTLEVPPALETTARSLLNLPFLPSSTGPIPNPYQGTAEVLVNPWLINSTAWFLHVTTRGVKPFVYQLRKAPVFVQQITPDSDDVFMRKEFKFGAEARCAGGFAFWQLSYGSTGTV